MVVSIGETVRDNFITSMATWVIAALKTRIYDLMPERLTAHTTKRS